MDIHIPEENLHQATQGDGRTERWDWDPIVQDFKGGLELCAVDRFGEGRTILRIPVPRWLRRRLERWVQE